ncbi:ComF family protein [Chungangia koreensis]|uniref:ComF family protein n=1 Tax=Chungangia koreensis TaxID=752657 RepID=A0ABV8X2G0_9LACT
MNCLLCHSPMIIQPTWSGLFLNKIGPPICERCSKKFEKTDIKEDKAEWIGSIYENSLDGLTSVYQYNEAMKDYLHQYKFLQDAILSKVFAEDMRALLKNRKAIIVPIPMHPEKLKKRTFAHVDRILDDARIPYVHLFEKTADVTQGEKSKQERMNAEPLFAIKPGSTIEKKHYIVIDDLYTTGTTVRHAAKVLKDAGAAKVEAVTLIRA